MKTYDVIVIGSGHNALVTAAYLTRSGRSVLVLEKNDRAGGLVRTDELTLPGFKHDVYSAAHPLFLNGPAYADLGGALVERGLQYINTDLPTGVSLEDGQTAVFARSFEALAAEAERLAPGDGAALGDLLGSLDPHVNDIFALFNLDLTSPEATEIRARLLHNGDRPGYSAFAASLFETGRAAVEPFKSPVMRAMLAPWTMHMGRTPDEVGSGIWVKLVVLALMGAGMPIPQGGSEMLASSLARLIVDQGGVIRTETQVTRIIVENGKASKVRTTNNEEYQARQAIVASTNPDQLYLSLLAETDSDASLRTQAKKFRYGRGCVQIHLALNEPPRWPDARFKQVGQPHLSDGLNGCTLAIAQGTAGLLPTKPTSTQHVRQRAKPSCAFRYLRYLATLKATARASSTQATAHGQQISPPASLNASSISSANISLISPAPSSAIPSSRPTHWHTLAQIRDPAIHMEAHTTSPRAISSAPCPISQATPPQYHISIC